MTDLRRQPAGIDELAPSDIVRVRLRDPVHEAGHVWRSVEGEVFRILDFVYVASRERPNPHNPGLPVMVEIAPGNVQSLERLQTADARAAERHRAARGEIVFSDPPETAREVEAHLVELAGMIAAQGRAGHSAGDPGSARNALRRRDELLLQFHDVADGVALAQAKREYLLARARIGEGDFNPATWPDDRVLRIATVRPLPIDFEPDPRRRRSRAERRAQAERIFGAVEIETRELAAFLRRHGLLVLRPHPNGHRLEVRVKVGTTKAGDAFGRVEIAPSQNGLWEAFLAGSWNKGDARQQDRLRRSGAVALVAELVEEWQAQRRGG